MNPIQYDNISRPTLLIDPQRAHHNIQRMAEKASRAGVRLRPHFKTHQSAQVGEWFRPYGITAITVSSLDMAMYFARHGWSDILVAFSLNLRQIELVRQLSDTIRLGVLVECSEHVEALAAVLSRSVDIWIKVDSGSRRTGLAWDNPEKILLLARQIGQKQNLNLRGLLTHAGETYHSQSPSEVIHRFQRSNQRMNAVRQFLEQNGVNGLEVSVGDTPGCSLSDEFEGVDEIRPGNFVFYDAQMTQLGACREEDIAAVVACPLVALHAERGEAVVYGGAIHLSKDTVQENGKAVYGWPVKLNETGWSPRITSSAPPQASGSARTCWNSRPVRPVRAPGPYAVSY
ncbi:MAG: alanine racemase, partial [Bellilinea sp.]|nr:alanine racemase [Bellilinea sp.]